MMLSINRAEVMLLMFLTWFCHLHRSTVHSSTVPPSVQSESRRLTQEAARNFRVAEAVSGSQSKVSRPPPPRMPTGLRISVFS